MRTEGCAYRFGSFELDSSRRVLHRGGEAIDLADRYLDVLLLLVSNAGVTVTKQNPIESVWHDVFIEENSLAQAIASLRRTLGYQKNGLLYIETVPRRGYRFVAPVQTEQAPKTHVAFGAVLHPHHVFVDARAALETLDRGEVQRALPALEELVRAAPHLVAGHIGIANACVMLYESMRFATQLDRALLQKGEHHARESCHLDPLDPSSGEPWSTLAFVLFLQGNARDAVAAARNAISLERDDWRHHLALAFVSWSEERLRAAHRVSKLCPGLALAHWLAATVFLARQAFDAALAELRPGCAAQDSQRKHTGRFNIVGMHLLHGQVLAALGVVDGALQELQHELALGDEGHIYGRECYANVWYSIGAIRLREGNRDQAGRVDEAGAFSPKNELN